MKRLSRNVKLILSLAAAASSVLAAPPGSAGPLDVRGPVDEVRNSVAAPAPFSALGNPARALAAGWGERP